MNSIAIELLNKINDKGFESYIVGGYPRDLILNRNTIDIDICTNARPEDLKEIFGSMIRQINYGSVMVIYHGIRFEITTFRKDMKYKNNRFPVKIKYIDSFKKDLKRRDFTINTLCIDASGNIIDLLNGKKEIDAKTIKMVGNPKYRLKEDSLRILRAIRFATVLDFNLDKKLKKYIKKYGYLLKNLSYFRKKEELEKIFLSDNIKKGLSLIKELGLDKYLELSNIDDVKRTKLIGIWAQFDVLDIYHFSNSEKELIKKIKELMDKDVVDNYNLYKYGLEISLIVGDIKEIDKKIITEKYDKLPIKSAKDINLSTGEICDILNKKPDKFLSRIINDLEINILAGNLKNDKEELNEFIKKYKI